MKRLSRIYLYLFVSLTAAMAILLGLALIAMPIIAFFYRPLTMVDVKSCILGELMIVSGILWILAIEDIKL